MNGITHRPPITAMLGMDHLQVENTAALGALLKSVRDIMRKDKGLNGDLDRLQSQRSAAGRGRLSLQGD